MPAGAFYDRDDAKYRLLGNSMLGFNSAPSNDGALTEADTFDFHSASAASDFL
tara:strand:- start:844 stop:1002 length:159 start_codon:yes stop_codon:yes gene_type:complete